MWCVPQHLKRQRRGRGRKPRTEDAVKDEPDPKPGKPGEVPHPPTEAEFKDFARRLVSVPKAVVDRRAAEWAKRKSGKD